MIRRHLALALAACALLLPAASLATPPTAPTYKTPNGSTAVTQPVVPQAPAGDFFYDDAHPQPMKCMSGCSSSTADSTAANQSTQITAANLTNTRLGDVTETAPATDTASAGVNGRLQRIAQRLSTLITTMGSPLQAGGNVNTYPDGVADGGQTTFSLSSATSSSVVDMRGSDFGVVVFSGVGSGTVAVKCSVDGTAGTGTNFQATPFWSYSSSARSAVLMSLASPSANTVYVFAVTGHACRLDVTSYSSGTFAGTIVRKRGVIPVPAMVSVEGCVDNGTTGTTCKPVLTGCLPKSTQQQAGNNSATTDICDLNGARIFKSYSPSASDWSYVAASGGINNTTTAVTMQGAAGSGIRYYITACQVSAATLSGPTDWVVRDGASGTVIVRVPIEAGGMPLTPIPLPTPIPGSPNTLLEQATTSAVTGRVSGSCQGYKAN